jgi:hypothetical protein
MAHRRENPAAPIAKTITVAGDRNRGADDDVIRRRQIGNAREMDIEHCDQRSGLRELVLQFVADPKFHVTLSALPPGTTPPDVNFLLA